MRIALRGLGLVAVLGLVLVGSANRASADPIATLFSTGVNASGNVLPNLAVDPHYSVSPGSGPFVIANPAAVPWVGNTATSRWITPAQNTAAGPGPFTYTTTFDMTDLDPASAQITGNWSSDNQGQMFLNGNLVAVDPFPGWTTMVPFSISSGFLPNMNTLTFVVPNGAGGGDGPTGLQVQITSATAAAIPEPTTLALFGLGALGLLGRRLRKKNHE